jgi:hypothetical protein
MIFVSALRPTPNETPVEPPNHGMWIVFCPSPAHSV